MKINTNNLGSITEAKAGGTPDNGGDIYDTNQ